MPRTLATAGIATTLALALSACADTASFGDLFASAADDEPPATPGVEGVYAGIEPGNGLPPTPTFTGALAQLYPVLAERMAGEGDPDAARFAAKGERAAAGTVVEPDYPPSKPLALTEKGELDTAYARLSLALLRGARSATPASAAEAQVTFDCWLEEVASIEPNEVALDGCRTQHLRTMAEITAGVTAETPIRVYFPSGGSRLDAEAESALDDVARLIQDTGATVDLIGRTDAIGSAAANERLSLRRAERVRDALVARGVPADRIGEVTGRGEDEAITDIATGARATASDRRVDIIVRL